jgi:hypothetical protein
MGHESIGIGKVTRRRSLATVACIEGGHATVKRLPLLVSQVSAEAGERVSDTDRGIKGRNIAVVDKVENGLEVRIALNKGATHALEVAQVAGGIARATGLNVALAEAIAIGHDCGHGPGGHASEDAFDVFVPGGFDHAPWGANVSLTSLNLCIETLDGIRNHSWSRPAPTTPEGEVVSWADRIAYVCHDFEDAVSAGIVSADDLPAIVRDRCGSRRGQQLGAFITAMVRTIRDTGVIGMDAAHAEALAGSLTASTGGVSIMI